MQNDEVSGEISDRREAGNKTKPRSRKKHLLISVQAVTFLAGLALLIFLIYKTGYATILGSMSRVGWGFLFIVGLNILRHLLRAASLYMAIAPEHRTFGYRKVAAARFGGEAVNFFSFVGPFLGDAAKAVLLRKDLALTHGASAVITDNILYYLSVVLMILAGVVTLVLVYGSSGRAMTDVLAVIVIGAVLLLVLPLLAVKYKIKPATKVMNFLLDRRMMPQFIAKGHQSILDVEANVLDFYHKRRGDFFLVFGISVGVHVLSVTEVFLAMRFLGYEAPVSTAFIIESLTKVINAVFGFIPGTMGVYEGGNVLILSASGYTAAAGISLALVRRGAILISTLIGLLVLLSRTARRKRRSEEKNH